MHFNFLCVSICGRKPVNKPRRLPQSLIWWSLVKYKICPRGGSINQTASLLFLHLSAAQQLRWCTIKSSICFSCPHCCFCQFLLFSQWFWILNGLRFCMFQGPLNRSLWVLIVSIALQSFTQQTFQEVLIKHQSVPQCHEQQLGYSSSEDHI